MAVEQHADEHGNDRAADQMDGQKAFDPNRESGDRDGGGNAGQKSGNIHGGILRKRKNFDVGLEYSTAI